MSDQDVAIEDLALVGDTRSAALIAPDGAIVWWCLPRFDGAPVFGSLIGGDDAGRFVFGPIATCSPAVQAYKQDTATVVTTWRVDGAEVRLEDAMVAEVEGQLLPATVLVRRISCAGGDARVQLAFSPRFGYSRERAHRVRSHRGTLLFDHGNLVVTIAIDAPMRLTPDDVHELTLHPGDEVTVVVTATENGPAVIVPPKVARETVARDERGWKQWCGKAAPDVPHRSAVVRSLLTMQLLTYSPSGAPVAAPTASLPEEIGGGRNWDYRYAWPRDAAIGVSAFLAAGRDQEAIALLGWLLHATRLSRPRLPPLLTLDGRPGPPERVLDTWPGYRGSRPVRVGNGAADQHQLDVYGWLLDAAWALTRNGRTLYGETWRAFSVVVDHVADHWREPDAGIWERRGSPSHHVHSKLMAWLALDRALRIGATRRLSASRRSRWTHERGAIAEQIRERGYDRRTGTYTGIYETPQLDAAVLLLPVPSSSPRDQRVSVAPSMRSASGSRRAARCCTAMSRGTTTCRALEGAFLACSFWLVQALACTGRRDEAERLLDELLGLASPLGLYGEEMDPTSHAHLGNFPQALTHAALVQAVLAIRP